jgi:6-phosphogluconate dehydrogenase
MQLGIVGLGRMGANLALHAQEKGHEVFGYSRSVDPRNELAKNGIVIAASLEELVKKLNQPRAVFLYVPNGAPTEEVCGSLRELMGPGDIVCDGGNSHWADSQRRHAFFAEGGIHFLDVGTSGGVAGARHGACFMVGGQPDAYAAIAPLLRDLAVDDQGVFLVGGPGTGHFAKLVHNAIEFGMVQAIAEGVELLRRSGYELDVAGLLNNWMHGSVIRSWLVELMGHALAEHSDFSQLSTYVEDTGEVKWVLDWALGQDIPTPVVSASQTALMQYRDMDWPAAKAVALLRNQYGGHPVHRISDPEARR